MAAAAIPAHVGQLLESLMITLMRRNATVIRAHQTTHEAAAPTQLLLPFTGQRQLASVQLCARIWTGKIWWSSL